jgi:hypothetical protein
MAPGAKRLGVLAAPSEEKDIEILHEFRSRINRSANKLNIIFLPHLLVPLPPATKLEMETAAVS